MLPHTPCILLGYGSAGAAPPNTAVARRGRTSLQGARHTSRSSRSRGHLPVRAAGASTAAAGGAHRRYLYSARRPLRRVAHGGVTMRSAPRGAAAATAASGGAGRWHHGEKKEASGHRSSQ
eukprot:scaffold2544_cov401-Prasinococcus_capsulatus_cf.AAC.6